jgi:hypothetical protein
MVYRKLSVGDGTVPDFVVAFPLPVEIAAVIKENSF